LLWGKKAKETPASSSSWTASHFDDPGRKDKFLKLMGAKKKRFASSTGSRSSSSHRTTTDVSRPGARFHDCRSSARRIHGFGVY